VKPFYADLMNTQKTAGKNMLELMLGGYKKIEAGGQQAWTSPGTYTFTVPTGVEFISGAMVGSGGGGAGGTTWAGGAQYYGGGGGGGGALIYFNDYPVKPGDTFEIVVGAGGSGGAREGGVGSAGAVSTLKHNGVLLFTINGGNPGSPARYGGGGGTYALATGSPLAPYVVGKNGSTGGNGVLGSTGGGAGPQGGAASYTSASNGNNGQTLDGGTLGARYGNGGSGGSSGNPAWFGSAGAKGGARLMWGGGRSYPGNAKDVVVPT